ncbi:MAG: DUF106 domain-containing protein [Thermoplasmatota archaeon]
MADAAEPPKRKSNLMTFLGIGAVFLILFDNNLREATGNAVGFVMDPVVGFNGDLPVLTLVLAGTFMVLLTTVVRHFTTDWLEMARTQGYMRHFQKEMGDARKANNTFKLKKLQDKQPEVLMQQQAMSTKQLKTMPLTMLLVIPLFAWMFTFVSSLNYTHYATPWNPAVDMFATNGILFGSSVFPHWILLYMAVSIPFGAVVQRIMKWFSWKERWAQRHPEVND